MRYLVLFLLGLLVLPVQASVKVDVFSTEVVLDSESDNPEQAARIDGMKQVIVKASGDKASIDNPVVRKALGQSGSYLSQIAYGDQAGQQTLKMTFNPPQIQSLLSQANLPYWTDERSNLVVWVIQEGQYGREILWEHSGNSSLNQIKYFADLRGLPVTVPVGDIEDVTTITGPDLWGGFVEPISGASQRYPSDAVLVIRVQKAADGSYIRWTLYDEKPQFMVDSKRQPVSGSASGETYQALETVIDEVSNYYALRSSVKASGKSEDTLLAQFINVSSAPGFFALEKLLQQLNSVADVDLKGVVGNQVTFEVHLLGSELDFESEVVQNNRVRKFELEEDPFMQPDEVVPSETMSSETMSSESTPLENGEQVMGSDSDTSVNPEAGNPEKTPSLAGESGSETGVYTEEVSGTDSDLTLPDPVSEEIKPLVFEWIS